MEIVKHLELRISLCLRIYLVPHPHHRPKSQVIPLYTGDMPRIHHLPATNSAIETFVSDVASATVA